MILQLYANFVLATAATNGIQVGWKDGHGDFHQLADVTVGSSAFPTAGQVYSYTEHEVGEPNAFWGMDTYVRFEDFYGNEFEGIAGYYLPFYDNAGVFTLTANIETTIPHIGTRSMVVAQDGLTYVKFDAAHVPEPSIFGMLAVAVAFILRRRHAR